MSNIDFLDDGDVEEFVPEDDGYFDDPSYDDDDWWDDTFPCGCCRCCGCMCDMDEYLGEDEE